MRAKASWKEKLFPGRFPGMSPKMAAIVGYVCGEKYTKPSIEELVVTSDGFVLARLEGDIGANDLVGSYDDLDRNWKRLMGCAGLSAREEKLASCSYCARLKR